MPYVDLSETGYGVIIVQAVRKQLKVYTKPEAEKEKLSCELQVMVGETPEPEYKNNMNNKLLPKFPIIINDNTSTKYILEQT